MVESTRVAVGRSENFESRIADKLGRAEKHFPGQIAKHLLANDDLVERESRRFRFKLKTLHHSEDINAEVSIGAAIGIADWLFSDRKYDVRAQMHQHIGWHMGHWSRASRQSIRVQCLKKGFKLTPVSGVNSLLARAEQEEGCGMAEVERIAETIDPTGICLWAVRCYAGGAKWVDVSRVLGVTRSAVCKMIRRAIRNAATGNIKMVGWSDEVVERWKQATA